MGKGEGKEEVRSRELEGAFGCIPPRSRRFLRRTGSGQAKRPLEMAVGALSLLPIFAHTAS